jgi:hypothetical protein
MIVKRNYHIDSRIGLINLVKLLKQESHGLRINSDVCAWQAKEKKVRLGIIYYILFPSTSDIFVSSCQIRFEGPNNGKKNKFP